MKKFKYLLIIISTFIFIIVSNVNAELYYECDRITTGHPWWNPFTWFTNYASVRTSNKIEFDNQGNTYLIYVIACDGTGDDDCPPCSFIIKKDPDDNILDQNFLSSSANTMENFMVNKIQNGIYSGTQSFDTYYNNHLIYRNISWDGDTTSTKINTNMNILPQSINP